jgi:hypothetical protein
LSEKERANVLPGMLELKLVTLIEVKVRWPKLSVPPWFDEATIAVNAKLVVAPVTVKV